uniref:hypothetical protein n=1 Tax=Adlercreutzia sp. ZJ473 TaxID=2722822 RepID=UPI001C12D1A2
EGAAPAGAPAGASAAAVSDPAPAGAIEDELADFIARARERVAAALGDNLAIVEADGPQVEGR